MVLSLVGSHPELHAITWVDNYSHIYHKTTIKVSQSDYRKQLWTAEARCLVQNTNGNINFAIRKVGTEVVAIMPDTMFVYRDILQSIVLATTATSGFRYEDSYCVKWAIKTSPPKPDLRCLSASQKQGTRLQSRFLTRFVPVCLHDYNIGSNPGLSRFMRELFEKVTHAPYNERYHIVMADVSIFERMLKVICSLLCH